MAYCSKCGVKIEIQADYCPDCGGELTDRPLADRSFWGKYWEKADFNYLIPEDYRFHEILKKEFKTKTITSFLEIGGFPGNYSIYAAKYLNVNPTLLDFYIDEDIIEQFTNYNKVERTRITVLEKDLFTYQPDRKYDFVLSVGFIEHFNKVEELIEKHLAFLNDHGTLLMSIPNLRGCGGLAHLLWHRDNLKHHNLSIMSIPSIIRILKKMGIHNFEVFYYGSFGMWLDNYDEHSKLNRWLYDNYYTICEYLAWIVPVKRLFAPHILIKISR